jgi:hypothetical protein
VKALSLTEPWASLVIDGRKRIETRSWPTHYTGPLAIHAAKKPDRDAIHRFGYFTDELHLGCVLGTVRLDRCFRFSSKGSELVGVSLEELSYGDFTPGRYGFILSNPQRLVEPISVRGLFGLWNWDGRI